MSDRRALRVQLATPAFLGGADKRGEWRSPPFKALLRQWWRVVRAAELKWVAAAGSAPTDLHKQLRAEEGVLFGHAWLTHRGSDGRPRVWSSRSPVQVVLRGWERGRRDAWPHDSTVEHQEVDKPVNHMVGAHLYLGYGPLQYDKPSESTRLDRRPALDEGEQGVIGLRFPARLGGVDVGAALESVLLLAAWFGAIGSRSRNGWGSLELYRDDGTPLVDFAKVSDLNRFARPLSDCLALDWPHAIGKDDKGLFIWRSNELFTKWEAAMAHLAAVKIAFRTALSLSRNQDVQDVRNARVDQRHILAYPVTHHGVLEWSERFPGGGPKTFRDKKGIDWLKQDHRLANQLRFKVHRVASQDGDRFLALAVHLPHRVPEPLVEELPPTERIWLRAQELAVWQAVHATLDSPDSEMTRL